VRIVFRDFPLPNHSMALPAAEAAQCAHEQGKFWEYHDKVFQNQISLTPDNLKKFAEETGVDLASFNACVESGRNRASVQGDYQDGQRAGVSGTPAFFVNGRFVSGAQPFEQFQSIIDEELQR
jgi:protein-disulfide isomerase